MDYMEVAKAQVQYRTHMRKKGNTDRTIWESDRTYRSSFNNLFIKWALWHISFTYHTAGTPTIVRFENVRFGNRTFLKPDVLKTGRFQDWTFRTFFETGYYLVVPYGMLVVADDIKNQYRSSLIHYFIMLIYGFHPKNFQITPHHTVFDTRYTTF